jgi:hypothetical protein
MRRTMPESSLARLNARLHRRNELVIRHWLVRQQELSPSGESMQSSGSPGASSQRSANFTTAHCTWGYRWLLAWTGWQIRVLQRWQRWLYQLIDVLEQHIQRGCARHLALQYAERRRDRAMREVMEYLS